MPIMEIDGQALRWMGMDSYPTLSYGTLKWHNCLPDTMESNR